MALYDALVLRRPLIPIALVAGVTALLAVRLPEFALDASSDSLIMEGDPDLAVYEESRLFFGSDEYVIAAARLPDAFTPEGVPQLVSVTETLRSIPAVEGVEGVTTVPLLRSRGKPPASLPELAALFTKPVTLATPGVDLARAKEELRTHALYGENLISADGETLAWIVSFAKDPHLLRIETLDKEVEKTLLERPPGHAERERWLAFRRGYWDEFMARDQDRKADRRRIVAEMRARLAEVHARGGPEFFLSGVPIIVVDMVSFIESDMKVFGGGALAFLVALLFAIFRKLRWVALPVATCALVVAWILGLLVVLEKKTTVVTSNLSSILFIVGMAYTIHVVVKYGEVAARRPDLDRLGRIREAVQGVLAPSFYAATTTMAGFASIAISKIRPVIEFGLFMTLGVALTFALSFVFFPAALALLRPTPPPAGGAESEQSPFLRGVAALNVRLGVPLVLLAAAVLGVSVWGMTKIVVETKFISYFKSGTDLYRGLDFIDNELGGTTTVEVVYQASKGAPEGSFLAREGFEDLRRMQAHLDAIPEIGKVMSVVNWGEEFEKLADSLPPPLLAFLLGKDVPREERGLRALRLLLGRGAPGEGNPVLRAMAEQAGMKGRLEALLRSFATPDFRKARIFTRARETAPSLRRNDVIARVRDHLRERPPAGEARADVTGIFVLYTNMLNSLMVSQVATFGLVFVAIFLMIALLFRSLALALLGMVPNVLPIAFVLGLLGWTGIPLDMATVMIASVAIGIGVDATIHYLFRYQREWRADGDYVAAMRRSHESVGKATLYTTIAVVGGFWILVLSNFKPMIYFGVLTGAAMLAALAASLTVLPVLVCWTKPFGRAPLPR